MADNELVEKVQDLSDLELAALICLVAQEHCIIDTKPDCLDDLVRELELVAANVFDLSHAVIDCSEDTSLDDFAHAILSVDKSPTRANSPIRTRHDSYFLHAPVFASGSRSPASENFNENKTMANVIIAKNLDKAPKLVQIQALELLKTKRLFTRTLVQNAPKTFLFITILADGEGPRLTKHLNDSMFISHFHDPEDGFPNLEEACDDRQSISSVVKRSLTYEKRDELYFPRISSSEIEHLFELSNNTTVTIEVKQYQMNIVSFLRLHRAVAGGITAPATKHFDKLTKCLAPLHNLTYATPSLVALAARKIYMHRIQIVKPEHERSMQWGSDLDAVAALLEGVGAAKVLEDVLGSSGPEVPL